MRGFWIGMSFLVCIAILFCVHEKDHKFNVLQNTQSQFSAPVESPYKHNVGICFSVEQETWFNNKSVKYNSQLKNEYTYCRLQGISKDFKLIRIYSFLVAGWEKTGDITPEAYSISKLAQNDNDVELVIGTSCNKQWFLDSNNVDVFIDTLISKLGSSINQVKTILIGNEINANGYNEGEISSIMTNYKKSLSKNKLRIPVTATFSNLPIQKGDTLSDALVKAIVLNWDTTWNNNKPFVFINPYPDAIGVNNAYGVYKWQDNVTKYYQSKYPNLQIFIGETGAEGSRTNYNSKVVINDIIQQLNIQYDSIGKTVPTFLFEAFNESLKSDNPDQRYMGVYFDSSTPEKTKVILKSGVKLPTWLNN